MALLNVVTAITQEIGYINELVESIHKRSNERLERMRKRYEEDRTVEAMETSAVADELNALKSKLAALIEEQPNNAGEVP